MDLKNILNSIFDYNHTILRDYFNTYEYLWYILSDLKKIIFEISKGLNNDFIKKGDNIWIGKGTRIADTACIKGPVIIGNDCDIRHCAYVRDNVIIGSNAVIGNSTEVKNSIIFDNASCPHFNYIGDSIMGYKSHLGAGAVLSNVKLIDKRINIYINDQIIDTGLKKFGSLIGDYSEIGSNSVLNPGSIIGSGTIVYPLSNVRGVIPGGMIFKNDGSLIKKHNI